MCHSLKFHPSEVLEHTDTPALQQNAGIPKQWVWHTIQSNDRVTCRPEKLNQCMDVRLNWRARNSELCYDLFGQYTPLGFGNRPYMGTFNPENYSDSHASATVI
jgi:hypothetical protein